MATLRALLILLPPMSVLVVVAVRSLGRVAARNLSALARAQLACLPAGGSSFRQLSAVERKSAISEEVLPVAPYRKEEEEEAAVECVLCLSGIEEGEEIRELKCRHLFHRICLDRWLARPAVATCPLCRCRLPTPPTPEDGGEEEEEEEDNSDMMLFMACIHGVRSSWFWPSS